SDAERLEAIAGSAKPRALILDHVGNVLFHYAQRGFPDSRQEYTLDRRERGPRKARDDIIPLRSCLECFQPYERFLAACPYCGAPVPAPAGRSSPELVDGDLMELDAAVLERLRAEVTRV